MLNKLEVAMADMQRDQAAAMLTFEQRHWAALLGNEQRLTERIEEGNVQVVAALALKLDTIQVGRALRRGAYHPCRGQLWQNFTRGPSRCSTCHVAQASAPMARHCQAARV